MLGIRSGRSALLQTGLLVSLFVHPVSSRAAPAAAQVDSPRAAPAAVQVDSPRSDLAVFIKDPTWVRLLGRTLFWDTVEVMSESDGTERASAGESSQADPGGSTGLLIRTLLEHRPVDKYLWLIHKGFDESLWRGPDEARVRQNFALIWRLSLLFYESSLDSGATRLRVCEPRLDRDELDCQDQTAPVGVLPIPTRVRLFGWQDEPIIG